MCRFVLFLILFTAISCSESEDYISGSSASTKYTATFDTILPESGITKTYFDKNIKILWHAEDELSIFSSTLNEKYAFDGETGDNSGTFSKIYTGNYGAGNEIPAAYAVYPYDKNNKIENDVSFVSVPLYATQTYAKGSIGRNANIAVAVTTSLDDYLLKFKNVCSYVCIRIYGKQSSIATVVLQGKNNEKLAGMAQIVASNSDVPVLSLEEDMNATNLITLDCGAEGVDLGMEEKEATEFWIVLPPTSFTKGITITVTDIEGNQMVKDYSVKLDFERNIYRHTTFKFTPTHNVTKDKERNALIALYNSLGGEQWTNKENWCSEEPVGNWEGVTTDESGFVVGIDLASNNLQGAMPDAIGDFSKLTTLDLSGNSISGTLPDGICRLTSLENLNLADNSLSGSIPNDIGNLSKVVMLDLSGNSLSGSVPESLWTGIAGLQKLFLNDNQLAGGLTASMGQATSLMELDLSGNSFNSVLPAQICSLVNLKVLDMNSAAVYGTIPASIGGMVSLVTLDLGNNGLSGTIPSSVTQLASLETLNLATNGLRGEIPQEIGSLANLKNLHLNNNMLEGSLPEGITGCTELDYLYLAYNAQLGGIIPASVFENLIGYSIEGTGVSIEQSATLPDLEPGGDINWN